jgi:hypothetical protein
MNRQLRRHAERRTTRPVMRGTHDAPDDGDLREVPAEPRRTTVCDS